MGNYLNWTNEQLLKELEKLKKEKKNASVQASVSNIESDMKAIVRILHKRGL